jgi:hypothetical protein
MGKSLVEKAQEKAVLLLRHSSPQEVAEKIKYLKKDKSRLSQLQLKYLNQMLRTTLAQAQNQNQNQNQNLKIESKQNQKKKQNQKQKQVQVQDQVQVQVQVQVQDQDQDQIINGPPHENPNEIELRTLDHKLGSWLFFTKNGVRKAPSYLIFNILWRVISNKAGLIALLQKRGIYCVYSKDFAKKLAKKFSGKIFLEIGAGDGTLSLLLEKYGASIQSCDNQSWEHKIQYPDWIEKIDGVKALKKYNPQVVICSWPPPDNPFELAIFLHPSVEYYIVIGSIHEFSTGNRRVYANAINYGFKLMDLDYSKYLLPVETQQQVLIFKSQKKFSET